MTEPLFHSYGDGTCYVCRRLMVFHDWPPDDDLRAPEEIFPDLVCPGIPDDFAAFRQWLVEALQNATRAYEDSEDFYKSDGASVALGEVLAEFDRRFPVGRAKEAQP